MRRSHLGDLTAFLAVADERNFTRAAAKLGTSQSALSHIVRRLEAGLGVKLLTRTTRSVATTQAGDRLIETLRPALDQIDTRIAALTAVREKPAGSVRISTSEHAAETVLWPKLTKLLQKYPDIEVELNLSQALTDIVTERFDAGVRLGERVARDMIAVPISPEIRMAVVGAQSYLDKHPPPKNPQDLTDHRCINLRLPTFGGLYVWEFEKRGREVNVRVEGQLTFNDVPMALKAAADGFGLAFVLEDQAKEYLKAGRLVRLMEDWCAPFAGYHLYYPSRRELSPAFSLVVDVLRYRK